MSDILNVSLFDRHVGVLTVSGEVRAPEQWSFVYDAEYLESARAIPLSVSLPVREDPWNGAVVHNWFANLLPEGTVRQAICQKLRIQDWDAFALLEAIGGECAGAVSITVPGQEKLATPETSLDLETLLAAQAGHGGDAEMALIGAPRRLSLAGAQDKIAVVLAEDGSIRLPATGEVTTHILKPDSLRIPGLREYEGFGLTLAALLELPVPHARLVNVSGHRALLVDRYDRTRDEYGHLQRLHQEDFCQALGYPSQMKYEDRGGPSLATCANLLRQRLRLGAKSLEDFLSWIAFNVLIGNADAHAKNLALVVRRDGTRSLAPFYDLVPTIAVSRSVVERKPALRIGAAMSIETVSASDWNQLAKAAGFGIKFVRARVRKLAEKIESRMTEARNQLARDGGDEARLDRVMTAVRVNTETTIRALD